MDLCQGWGSLQQSSTDVQEYRTERCRRWSWTSPGTGPRSKLPVSVWSSRMRRRCGRWLWPYPEQHSCSNANICDYFSNHKYQVLQAYLIKLQLLLEIQGENRFHAIIWISFTELVTNDEEHTVGILDFLKQEENLIHVSWQSCLDENRFQLSIEKKNNHLLHLLSTSLSIKIISLVTVTHLGIVRQHTDSFTM